LESALEKAKGLIEHWSRDTTVRHISPTSSTSVCTPRPLRTLGPTLNVYCLGRFRAIIDGEPLHSSRKNKSDGILKLLLVHFGNALPKDVLVETFWPDSSAATGDASFRVAMHNLRKKLARSYHANGHELIVFQGGSYSLANDASLFVDFVEFERHWEAGRLLEGAGREMEAISEFRRAEALYQGDFLEEDAYEDWAALKRESLRDTYMTVLAKIADFYLRIGDYGSCIEFSHKLLNRDAYREATYQYLMLSYARMGDRTRALRWHQVCRDALLTGIGQPPSPETEALRRRIAGGSAF
jgi:DNA-binding SARP family transcriptional activator